jgi:hypothetical protein
MAWDKRALFGFKPNFGVAAIAKGLLGDAPQRQSARFTPSFSLSAARLPAGS